MFELTSASTYFMPAKVQLMKAKAVEKRMVANLCFLQLETVNEEGQSMNLIFSR